MSDENAQTAGTLAAPYGRFVWHDLLTTEVESAKAFYSALLGWDIRDVPLGGGTYSMIFASAAEDAPGVGGFEALPAEDVDIAARRAADAGGTVLRASMEIPSVGRFGVIKDPAGGHVAPFQTANQRQPDPHGPRADGEFVWNELLTHDTACCAAFYPEVVGWTHASQDMPGPDGDEMTYHMWIRTLDGEPAAYFDAGMLQMPPGAAARTHWLHYVQVPDVDATVERTKDLGGAVHAPATDIPGIGRMAVLGDLQGASFAVYKPASR